MDGATAEWGALPPRLAGIAAEAQQEARRRAERFGWDPVRGLAGPRSPQPGDPRPLNVLMTRGGKSFFSSLREERVRLFWPGDPLTRPPDIVATSEPQRFADDPRTLDLPDVVWRRLASGQAKLLIDSSSEGYPYAPEGFSRIEDAIARAGVKLEDCIYVTQDRAFKADYLADLRKSGRDRPGVEILVHDRFIQYLFAAFQESGPADFPNWLRAHAGAGQVRRRRFISLNNKFRPVRMLFLLRLLRDELWDDGFISLGDIYEFAGHPLSKAQMMKRMLSAPGMGPLARELIPYFAQIEAHSPQYVGLGDVAPKRGAEKKMVVPRRFAKYGDSWFSIVVETDFSNRLHRITEKPFKPLLCLHPMIILGSCGSLSLIKEYGFESFPGLFDESYDQEADPRARFEMVYEQVVRLCRMAEAELARSCDAVAEAVVFNACWGLTQMPTLFRDCIDAALVDRLIALAHGPATQLEPA